MALRVSILGCGWLGFPLASRLHFLGMMVRGSTSTVEKMPVLQEKHIHPYLIRLNPLCLDDTQDFFESDALIITIPFKRNSQEPEYYLKQIQSIIKKIEKSSLKPKIIYTSSTLVYPNTSNQVELSKTLCQENDKIYSKNARVRVLLEIESMIMQVGGTVLRCAGLYGPNREIHKFLSKQVHLKSGRGVLNLIHLEDCIGIIESVILKQAWGHIFNAVSDQHPTRQSLYEHLAKKYHGVCPLFDNAAHQQLGKIVANDKIKRVLEYRFIHPDPMEA